MRLDRRRFAAALTGVLTLGGLARPAAGRPASGPPVDLVGALVKDLRAAQRLGAMHLAQVGPVEGAAALARARALVATAQDERTLRAAVRARSDAELRAHEIALVDGWVVSRTEADILALTTLLRS